MCFLPQSGGKVVVRKEALVDGATMEFPRMNYNFAGRENKYFYALGSEYLHPNKVSEVLVFAEYNFP